MARAQVPRLRRRKRPPTEAASWAFAGAVWKMMSVRAVGRTAKVAVPFQVANDPAPNVAKPVPAVDRLELCIRQLEDFRVLLLHVLHCSLLLFRSGGPF